MRARSSGSRTCAPAKTRCRRAERVREAPRPEGRDRVLFERHAAAEGARVGLAVHEEGRRRLAPGVRGEQGFERPAAEAVAVDDQHAVGLLEERAQWRQGAGGAEELALLRVDERHAAETVAESVANLASQVMQVDRHRLAAGGAQALERPGEERPPGDAEERLGEGRGQRTQALAAPGGENERAQAEAGHVSGRSSERVMSGGGRREAAAARLKGCRGRSCRAARPGARRCSPRRASGSSCAATS